MIAILGVLAFSAPAEAAVTHTFNANALQITTSAADSVVVTCNAGNTAVNGSDLTNPSLVPCADVQSLTVTGTTSASTATSVNLIDLSGVTASDFTTLASVLVNGGDEPTGPGDTITGSPLNDTINGGAGDETINAGAGVDTIAGDNGNDIITAGPGNETDVRGGNANDTLIWNPGDGSDSSVNGQGGDDIIQVNGDAGNDQFTVAGDGDGDGFLIDRLAPTTGQIHVTGPTEVVSISTGDGTDTITGGADVAAGAPLVTSATTLQGGNDVDTITGTEGRDTITGGAGNDILAGAGGDDTAVWSAGDGDDSFSGGGGADVAQANGDGTSETFTFSDDGSGVDIDRTLPSTAHIEADTIERVTISAGLGDDTVDGSAVPAALGVASTLSGGSGVDALTGTGANDILGGGTDDDDLTGGNGDDSFTWNSGDDTDDFHGGPGTDTATVNGSATPDTYCVNPAGGDFDINEGAPCTAPIVDADAIERVSINGNAGNDTISAQAGFNPSGIALTFSGGADTDTITGSDAADTLNGNAGSDTVDGAGGDDQLTLDPQPTATDDYDGEGGDDTLTVNPESGNGIWSLAPDVGGKWKLARQAASPTVTMLAGTIEHLSIDLGSGTDSLTASGLLAPLGLQTTNLKGDSGNDTITGTDLADTIDGGSNNDTVHGGDGNDMISPGGGSGTTNDDVFGDAGSDTMTLNGDTSNEAFAIAPNGTALDIQRTATSPVTAADVDAETIEALTVNGGNGNDMITPAAGLAALNLATTLAGGAQDDTITGTDDSDTLNGDAGADTIMARDGVADQVDCGSEADTAQTDRLSLDSVANCETVDALAEPPVTTPTTTTPTPAADPCAALRAQLQNAKSKKKRKKLRRKLRQKGC